MRSSFSLRLNVPKKNSVTFRMKVMTVSMIFKSVKLTGCEVPVVGVVGVLVLLLGIR